MELDNLLSNYKGTLSVKDQNIFFELKKYDHTNFNLFNEDGFIEFGKSRKRNQSVESNESAENAKKKSDESNDDAKLTNQKTEDKINEDKSESKPQIRRTNDSLTRFLRQFKQPLIKSSVFSFPLDIKLDQLSTHEFECLDPRFLLFSFNQIISRQKTTLEEFIETNCLAIVFVSLSFEESQMRRVAFTVLAQIRQNLCKDSYGTIWGIILDKFAASFSEYNQLIPPVITSFFAHIIPFIKTPTYSIHENLTSFLAKQPLFKFHSIVSFILSILLFEGEKDSFYQEVGLLMLKNGLKTEMDFNLCLKSKLIDFLLTNYNSSLLFKQNLKCKILDIFRLICQLPAASKLLCVEKGFLLWLNQQIINETDIEILTKINQIINQLNELNRDFYPIFKSELKMIKNVCTGKIDHLFEQESEN